MFQDWFVCTLIATMLYGVMYFFLKIAADRGYSSSWMVNVSASVVLCAALVSSFVEALNGSVSPNFQYVLLYALLNGTFFMCGSLIRFKVLKLLPASIVFPLSKINIIFTTLSGLIIFHESLNLTQGLGFLLFFCVIMLLSQQEKHEKVEHLVKGILLAVLAGICIAISVTVGKFAADKDLNLLKINYIACSYLFVSSFTAIIGRKGISKKNSKPARNPWKEKQGVLLGAGAGICNFFGYMLVLRAFSTGDLSIIHPIFSLSILIPIVLSIIFLKERLTMRRGAAIILAMFAIVCMKVDLLNLAGITKSALSQYLPEIVRTVIGV